MDFSRRSFIQAIGAALAATGLSAWAPKSGMTRVCASNQVGYQLVLWEPPPSDWKMGDVFTIEGVHSLSRIENKVLTKLRQFVLTANPNGHVITFYPGIIPVSTEYTEHYCTVDAAPKNYARLTKFQLGVNLESQVPIEKELAVLNGQPWV